MGNSALSGRRDQPNRDHGFAGNPGSAATHVEQNGFSGSLKQQAFASLVLAGGVTAVHFHRKSAEAAEIPIVVQHLAHAWAAHFQNIGLGQQAGGFECAPVSAELTYGLERIAMYLQNKDDVYDLRFASGLSYRDMFHQNEVEMSRYNFELADVDMLLAGFAASQRECERLCAAGVPIPAYDHVMKCSHLFNLLQARGAISVAERAQYIKRVRDLACLVARTWSDSVSGGAA